MPSALPMAVSSRIAFRLRSSTLNAAALPVGDVSPMKLAMTAPPLSEMPFRASLSVAMR